MNIKKAVLPHNRCVVLVIDSITYFFHSDRSINYSINLEDYDYSQKHGWSEISIEEGIALVSEFWGGRLDQIKLPEMT